MSESVYENFRTVLTMNLCSVTDEPELLKNILKAVDFSVSDFDIKRKQMDIIPVDDMAPVIECYLAAKGVANLSLKTLKQYHYKLIKFFDTVRKSYMDVQTNDIRIYLYKYKIEHNSSDCYIDNIRITLNSFFQWLLENDQLYGQGFAPCINRMSERLVIGLSVCLLGSHHLFLWLSVYLFRHRIYYVNSSFLPFSKHNAIISTEVVQ